MPSVVVLTGGGIKGAVAAGRYANDHQLTFLHVDYGQPSGLAEVTAVRELASAHPSSRVIALTLPHLMQLQRTTAHHGASGNTVDDSLSPAMLHGLVAELFAVAAQCAIRVGASIVTTGLMQVSNAAHIGLGPGSFSRDDRRELLHAFNILMDVLGGTKHPLRVEAPLMDLSYAEVIKLGVRFRVPFDRTRTCRRAETIPCGVCESCRERSAGFAAAGMPDPAFEALAAAVTGSAGPRA